MLQDQENPLLPVKLVQGDKGKRGGFRVDYKTVLASIVKSSESAAKEGIILQQVVFLTASFLLVLCSCT
jgi:hypothetical protein